jgi:hypothetical protein
MEKEDVWRVELVGGIWLLIYPVCVERDDLLHEGLTMVDVITATLPL